MSGSVNTLPQEAKLQLTNGYSPRFDQISRLLSYVVRRTDVARIPQPDIAAATGLSERQVENLASLSVGMGLLRARVYKTTELGALVLRYDPFFDDLGTLWVCHYQLASQARHIIWNRMTNLILPAAREPVSAAGVTPQFDDLRERFSAKSVAKHVPKELQAFFRTYSDYRFSKLDYLVDVNGGYRLSNRPVPVPERVFLALVLLYRDRFSLGATGVEIPDLCGGDNSPGRLLNMTELRVRETLESLNHQGLLDIESRANLDQIRFRPGLSVLDALSSYYRAEERS